MKKLLNEETTTQIKELLSSMKKDVTLLYFTKDDCENCNLTQQLLEEMAALNPLITLKLFNIKNDKEAVLTYNIEGAPSYAILNHDNKKAGATFYGVPAGHEINTLITNLLDASDAFPLFDEATLKQIKSIKKDINIKVFVTVSCPHCPGAAINASRLASVNPNIKTEIYEATSFNEKANLYQVSGVPKIVINETESLMGNQPIDAYLNLINKL